MADAKHSEAGHHIVVHHATDAATQACVRDALRRSLDAWWQFCDGIQAAIRAGASEAAPGRSPRPTR